jgi:hypothetical protein
VVGLVPGVGLLPDLVGMALGAVVVLGHVSEYYRKKREHDAFGPYAANVGVADPDGTGLLIETLGLGVGLAAIPTLAIVGKLAGRLVRFFALEQSLVWFPAAMKAAEIKALADQIEGELKRSKELDDLDLAEATAPRQPESTGEAGP